MKPSKQIVIGLTGSAGSGKSTCAEIFKELGIPVVDADKLAYQVCDPGEPGLKRIAEVFGDEFVKADGSYDRDRMRELVSSDREALERLNETLHPIIRSERERAFDNYSEAPILVYDCPLLFEAGEDSLVDEILFVTLDKNTRIERLMKRDGLDRESAIALIDLQDDEEEKIGKTQAVIYNDGDREDLERAVKAYLERLEK